MIPTIEGPVCDVTETPKTSDGNETPDQSPVSNENENTKDEDDLPSDSEPKNEKNEEPSQDDLCTIYVGQLHRNVTEEILYELFLQAGPLVSARIASDKEGTKRNFGFVEYVYEITVPYAIALFEGTKLFGRELRLNSRNKTRIDVQKIRREFGLPDEKSAPQRQTRGTPILKTSNCLPSKDAPADASERQRPQPFFDLRPGCPPRMAPSLMGARPPLLGTRPPLLGTRPPLLDTPPPLLTPQLVLRAPFASPFAQALGPATLLTRRGPVPLAAEPRGKQLAAAAAAAGERAVQYVQWLSIPAYTRLAPAQDQEAARAEGRGREREQERARTRSASTPPATRAPSAGCAAAAARPPSPEAGDAGAAGGAPPALAPSPAPTPAPAPAPALAPVPAPAPASPPAQGADKEPSHAVSERLLEGDDDTEASAQSQNNIVPPSPAPPPPSSVESECLVGTEESNTKEEVISSSTDHHIETSRTSPRTLREILMDGSFSSAFKESEAKRNISEKLQESAAEKSCKNATEIPPIASPATVPPLAAARPAASRMGVLGLFAAAASPGVSRTGSGEKRDTKLLDSLYTASSQSILTTCGTDTQLPQTSRETLESFDTRDNSEIPGPSKEAKTKACSERREEQEVKSAESDESATGKEKQAEPSRRKAETQAGGGVVVPGDDFAEAYAAATAGRELPGAHTAEGACQALGLDHLGLCPPPPEPSPAPQPAPPLIFLPRPRDTSGTASARRRGSADGGEDRARRVVDPAIIVRGNVVQRDAAPDTPPPSPAPVVVDSAIIARGSVLPAGADQGGGARKATDTPLGLLQSGAAGDSAYAVTLAQAAERAVRELLRMWPPPEDAQAAAGSAGDAVSPEGPTAPPPTPPPTPPETQDGAQAERDTSSPQAAGRSVYNEQIWSVEKVSVTSSESQQLQTSDDKLQTFSEQTTDTPTEEKDVKESTEAKLGRNPPSELETDSTLISIPNSNDNYTTNLTSEMKDSFNNDQGSNASKERSRESENLRIEDIECQVEVQSQSARKEVNKNTNTISSSKTDNACARRPNRKWDVLSENRKYLTKCKDAPVKTVKIPLSKRDFVKLQIADIAEGSSSTLNVNPNKTYVPSNVANSENYKDSRGYGEVFERFHSGVLHKDSKHVNFPPTEYDSYLGESKFHKSDVWSTRTVFDSNRNVKEKIINEDEDTSIRRFPSTKDLERNADYNIESSLAALREARDSRELEKSLDTVGRRLVNTTRICQKAEPLAKEFAEESARGPAQSREGDAAAARDSSAGASEDEAVAAGSVHGPVGAGRPTGQPRAPTGTGCKVLTTREEAREAVRGLRAKLHGLGRPPSLTRPVPTPAPAPSSALDGSAPRRTTAEAPSTSSRDQPETSSLDSSSFPATIPDLLTGNVSHVTKPAISSTSSKNVPSQTKPLAIDVLPSRPVSAPVIAPSTRAFATPSAERMLRPTSTPLGPIARPTSAPTMLPTAHPLPAPAPRPTPSPTAAPRPASGPSRFVAAAPTEPPPPRPASAALAARAARPSSGLLPAPTQPSAHATPMAAPASRLHSAPVAMPAPRPTSPPTALSTPPPAPAPLRAPTPRPTSAPMPAPMPCSSSARTPLHAPRPASAPMAAPTSASMAETTTRPISAPMTVKTPRPASSPLTPPTPCSVPAQMAEPTPRPAPAQMVIPTSRPASASMAVPTLRPGSAPKAETIPHSGSGTLTVQVTRPASAPIAEPTPSPVSAPMTAPTVRPSSAPLPSPTSRPSYMSIAAPNTFTPTPTITPSQYCDPLLTPTPAERTASRPTPVPISRPPSTPAAAPTPTTAISPRSDSAPTEAPSTRSNLASTDIPTSCSDRSLAVEPSPCPTATRTSRPVSTPTPRPATAPITPSTQRAASAAPTLRPASAPTETPTPRPTLTLGAAPTPLPATAPTPALTSNPDPAPMATRTPRSAPAQLRAPTSRPASAPLAAPTPRTAPAPTAVPAFRPASAPAVPVDTQTSQPSSTPAPAQVSGLASTATSLQPAVASKSVVASKSTPEGAASNAATGSVPEAGSSRGGESSLKSVDAVKASEKPSISEDRVKSHRKRIVDSFTKPESPERSRREAEAEAAGDATPGAEEGCDPAEDAAPARGETCEEGRRSRPQSATEGPKEQPPARAPGEDRASAPSRVAASRQSEPYNPGNIIDIILQKPRPVRVAAAEGEPAGVAQSPPPRRPAEGGGGGRKDGSRNVVTSQFQLAPSSPTHVPTPSEAPRSVSAAREGAGGGAGAQSPEAQSPGAVPRGRGIGRGQVRRLQRSPPRRPLGLRPPSASPVPSPSPTPPSTPPQGRS